MKARCGHVCVARVCIVSELQLRSTAWYERTCAQAQHGKTAYTQAHHGKRTHAQHAKSARAHTYKHSVARAHVHTQAQHGKSARAHKHRELLMTTGMLCTLSFASPLWPVILRPIPVVMSLTVSGFFELQVCVCV